MRRFASKFFHNINFKTYQNPILAISSTTLFTSTFLQNSDKSNVNVIKSDNKKLFFNNNSQSSQSQKKTSNKNPSSNSTANKKQESSKNDKKEEGDNNKEGDNKNATLYAKKVDPNSFEEEMHYYPKVLNAELHPMMEHFLKLSTDQIAQRYCHLNPMIDKTALLNLLKKECKYFKWSGADLFVTTTANGKRTLTVIETNSCPSGQKSMPRASEEISIGFGYKQLIALTLKPALEDLPPEVLNGCLAVIYDKNPMETTGYAAAMADVFGEPVYSVEYYNNDPNPPCKFDENNVLWIRIKDNEWKKVRAAFRYVTQNPWDRIPLNTKTLIFNPVIACLAGGRNKNLAAKAYDQFNAELLSSELLNGVQINAPLTIKDVSIEAIPFFIDYFGGVAVIKSPYGNGGVDVFTITNKKELNNFMNGYGKTHGRGYGSKFIVQSLIGNSNWSTLTTKGRYYHVGTVPDKRGNFYAADLRMMVHQTSNGWKPLCAYSRRAKKPLKTNLSTDDDNSSGNDSSLNTSNDQSDKDYSSDSWDMLGTNLSIKLGENKWITATNRLILMDTRDFNKLGIGLDDLISAFIQTVCTTIAIDNLCQILMNNKQSNKFDLDMFKVLNDDKVIIDDLKKCNKF